MKLLRRLLRHLRFPSMLPVCACEGCDVLATVAGYKAGEDFCSDHAVALAQALVDEAEVKRKVAQITAAPTMSMVRKLK